MIKIYGRGLTEKLAVLDGMKIYGPKQSVLV
jgi:hypothetical protein